MVRRRSTVRFCKGAPQVRRVFRLPIRRPLPVQGEGPEFNLQAKSQVRAGVSLPDRCGTVPAGRKISTIASLTGSFALARERPPSGIQCRWGANRGARSLSGGPDVVAPPGRLALWSHLTGEVVSSPGGALSAAGWAGRLDRPARIARGGARYPVDSCGAARRSVTCWTRCWRWRGIRSMPLPRQLDAVGCLPEGRSRTLLSCRARAGSRSQTDAAKAVCSRCPVRAECLSYARGPAGRTASGAEPPMKSAGNLAGSPG
jgi:hypothetical protein